MPIRPENKNRYPKNWKQIRAQILERARNRCEWCGLENHIFGIRRKDGIFDELQGMELEAAHIDGIRVTKIVLTIAHIDHIPENNDPTNLAALCQKCHLGHDMEQHIKNRRYFARLRLERAGQQTLKLESGEQ